MIGKFQISTRGFTLIELLVVISLIGILAGVILISLAGAREGARNAKRRADLEQIRSGLELYRTDCKKYPQYSATVSSGKLTFGNPLTGDTDPLTSCTSSDTYISSVPQDSVSSSLYLYTGTPAGCAATCTGYELCTALEGQAGSVACGGSSACGTGITCNYKVTQP